jgi:CBS domain-containing protein
MLINGGRRMQIKDVYRPGPIAYQPTDNLIEAARTMRAREVGALAVSIFR